MKLRDDASPLAVALEELIHDPYKYLLDNRKVRPDIEYAVNAIKQVEKRWSYIARLLHALTTLSNTKFGEKGVTPNNPTSTKLYELGNWVLESVTPESNRDSVLKLYVEITKDPDNSSVS